MTAHLRALVTLLSTAAGGRGRAVTSDYRPLFRYRGQDNDVVVTVPDDRWLAPGDAASVFVTFLRPDLQQTRIRVGSSFLLAEGRTNVAWGTIQEVLDPAMIDSTSRKQSVIFVDVDDTLIRSFGTKQIPIPNAIQYVREMHAAGHMLYCWSRGGPDYSRDVAIKLGIADCFVCFLPKPEIVLDDKLAQLLDHCDFIHPTNAKAQS